ncbi:MAG: Sjogren's syndrome/scleroderma autoantigen 1 family protein [Haloarcula sp.]
MSDFDKEAEREKLQKKFEQEEQNRQASEQMSELLLKGATMTNAHCSECGDPIFRYDGQEFCPTCQKPIARDDPTDTADEDDADATADDASDARAGQDETGIEMADPSDDARVQFGSDADDAERETVDTTEQTGQSTPTDPASVPHEAGDDSQPQQASQPEPSPETPPTDGVTAFDEQTESDAQPETGGSNPSVSARQSQEFGGVSDDIASELDAASALLAQTAHRFAKRAAATENPREAREHLKAAKEAAEALDAATF